MLHEKVTRSLNLPNGPLGCMKTLNFIKMNGKGFSTKLIQAKDNAKIVVIEFYLVLTQGFLNLKS